MEDKVAELEAMVEGLKDALVEFERRLEAKEVKETEQKQADDEADRRKRAAHPRSYMF